MLLDIDAGIYVGLVLTYGGGGSARILSRTARYRIKRGQHWDVAPSLACSTSWYEYGLATLRPGPGWELVLRLGLGTGAEAEADPPKCTFLNVRE